MYHLIKDSLLDNHSVIAEDGKVKACPFQHPLMLQASNIAGSKQTLQYKECGTFCIHFKIIKAQKEVVQISCTGSEQLFPIETMQIPKPNLL